MHERISPFGTASKKMNGASALIVTRESANDVIVDEPVQLRLNSKDCTSCGIYMDVCADAIWTRKIYKLVTNA